MEDWVKLDARLSRLFEKLYKSPEDTELLKKITGTLDYLSNCTSVQRRVAKIIMYRTPSIERTSDNSFFFIMDAMLNIKDKLTQRQVARFVVSKGNLQALSYYLSKKSSVKIDIEKKQTLTSEHVNLVQGMIACLGINLIYCDLVRKKNILDIISLDERLISFFEAHLIGKCKRYKTYVALTKYVESYPHANKRKILHEVFKERKHFKARIAINRLQSVPELERYFSMH